MKVVLLAGGFGTRISEESHLRPKPMIEIGGQPILWHIMKHYSHYGFNDFIICAGYKQEIIKRWFADYYLYHSDVTFDFTAQSQMEVHVSRMEPWRVSIVDTGLNTMTGGRVARIRRYIGEDETFMLTYGDGVSDVDLNALLAHHRSSGSLLTLTAYQPEGRFGMLDIDASDNIRSFREKKREDSGWINAGFMAVNSGIFDYLDEGDETILEQTPMIRIAGEGRMSAYRHTGFWRCMDTVRDKQYLENLWTSRNAPWKTWKDQDEDE